MLPLNLSPKKFQERPSGASGMQENLLAAGALLQELTVLPFTPSGLAAPFPKNLIPTVGSLGLRFQPFSPFGLTPDPK